MLLGRAYAACGKGEEAETVFDELIAAHPDDFRGYLAKVRTTLSPESCEGEVSWGKCEQET